MAHGWGDWPSSSSEEASVSPGNNLPVIETGGGGDISATEAQILKEAARQTYGFVWNERTQGWDPVEDSDLGEDYRFM